MRLLFIIFLSGTVIACNNIKAKEKIEEIDTGAVFRAAEEVPKEILATGKTVFTKTCQLCHNDTSKVGAPSMGVLSIMPPRSILAALRTGKMKTNAEKLSLEECEAVAQWISKKLLKETTIPQEAYTEFKLPPNSSIDQWISGWGGNLESTGFTTCCSCGHHSSQCTNAAIEMGLCIPGC